MLLLNRARSEPGQCLFLLRCPGWRKLLNLGDCGVSIKRRGRVRLCAFFFLIHNMVVVARASEKAAGAASASPAAADAHAPAAAKAEHAPSPKPSASPTSVDRFVSLPEFRVFSLEGKWDEDVARLEKQLAAAKVYKYEIARFTVVAALASWSSRAGELAVTLNSWQAKFKKRSVNTVGIFTHDSLSDIIALAKKQNLSFPLAKVGLDFVAKLLNPKVPTLWIVDHSGHVVYRKERPTDKEISEAEQFLLDWTDF